jgi:hypothetical protein
MVDSESTGSCPPQQKALLLESETALLCPFQWWHLNRFNLLFVSTGHSKLCCRIWIYRRRENFIDTSHLEWCECYEEVPQSLRIMILEDPNELLHNIARRSTRTLEIPKVKNDYNLVFFALRQWIMCNESHVQSWKAEHWERADPHSWLFRGSFEERLEWWHVIVPLSMLRSDHNRLTWFVLNMGSILVRKFLLLVRLILRILVKKSSKLFELSSLSTKRGQVAFRASSARSYPYGPTA